MQQSPNWLSAEISMSHAPIPHQAPLPLCLTTEGDNLRAQEDLSALHQSRCHPPQTEGYKQGKQSIHVPIVFQSHRLLNIFGGKEAMFLEKGPTPRSRGVTIPRVR